MLLRIGDKVINKHIIHQAIDQILELRHQGVSQQEVANIIGIDRTVISRLETFGEVRKGGRIALVGFPIKNCAELADVAKQLGVEYCLLLTEKERWRYVESRSGAELFNNTMEVIATLHKYDTVIMVGSNMRVRLLEALLDKSVIGLEIGESPIADDKYVEPDKIKLIIEQLHG